MKGKLHILNMQLVNMIKYILYYIPRLFSSFCYQHYMWLGKIKPKMFPMLEVSYLRKTGRLCQSEIFMCEEASEKELILKETEIFPDKR